MKVRGAFVTQYGSLPLKHQNKEKAYWHIPGDFQRVDLNATHYTGQFEAMKYTHEAYKKMFVCPFPTDPKYLKIRVGFFCGPPALLEGPLSFHFYVTLSVCTCMYKCMYVSFVNIKGKPSLL